MAKIDKRTLLAGLGVAGLGAGLAATTPFGAALFPAALAQTPAPAPRRKPIPNRMAKTTRLFKAPGPYPNALAIAPEGLWIAGQHLTEGEAKSAGAPMLTGKEPLWLVDWNGRLLKTLYSDAANTSGLACGGGALWAMANTSDAASGVHQVDLSAGREVAHRQIPLSPDNITGGIHGAQWHDGKLWIVNNRMRSLIRMNTADWTAEVQIPMNTQPGMGRFHDITFDKDGTILQVVANDSTSHLDSKAGLVRYNPDTGEAIETITFAEGACDPHGLENHNGVLVSCDAGFHPGWRDQDSPSSNWVFSIEMA